MPNFEYQPGSVHYSCPDCLHILLHCEFNTLVKTTELNSSFHPKYLHRGN